VVGERRVAVPRQLLLAAGGAVWLLVAAGVVAFTVRFGAPWTAVADGWRTFSHGSSSGGGSTLNGRLFSFYGSGRVTQWDVAWDQVKAHPWLGGGAGTWADYWVQHRPVASTVHNVHNLYLEALSETGPVGLLFTVGFLGAPFAALVRARKAPLVSAAAAALVAFAVHAIVDWDWQLAGVTVPALLCGVAIVVSADAEAVAVPRVLLVRVATGSVALLLALAVWMAVGRVELARITTAVNGNRWSSAQHDAHRAATLEPWSSEGWQRLGATASANGGTAIARSAYTRAVARQPANWALWDALAQVSSGAAKRRALARAHALNPLGGE
jgi:hypothetical protein